MILSFSSQRRVPLATRGLCRLRLAFITIIAISLVSAFQPCLTRNVPARKRPTRCSNRCRSPHRWCWISNSNKKSKQTADIASTSTTSTSSSSSVNDEPTTTTTNAMDQATKWKAEAQRIRGEVAQMGMTLTLQKIKTLKGKLSNPSWVTKNPDQVEILQEQLAFLQDTLVDGSEVEISIPNGDATDIGTAPSFHKPATTTTTASKSSVTAKESTSASSIKLDDKISDITTTIDSKQHNKQNKQLDNKRDKYRHADNPLCGFDPEDLDLYIPVVEAIEKRLPSDGKASTLEEQLIAFRMAPELQIHFQEKIRKLIVEPMQDMARLEQLQQEYLSSSSTLERKQLKREMEQLERTMEDESPFIYTDNILLDDFPVLQEDEIQQRIEAVSVLHPILQALYKQRCGVNETTGDLRLAIELDHYEPQLQILEQVRHLEPITDELRHEIRIAILSLPLSVRNHFAESLGIKTKEGEKGKHADIVSQMIKALIRGEQEQWMTLQQQVMGKTVSSSSSSTGGTITSNLDFMDRSRYVQEFLPALTRLELIHPSLEDIEKLMREVIDKNTFMVTSKPQRVVGGYYIYGNNLLADSENDNSDKLVSYLQDKLQKSSLADKIDLFYIQDPSPPSDEAYELGADLNRPVLVATAKSREELYNPAPAAVKLSLSLLSLISIILFGAATTEMQPIMRDQLELAAAGDLSVDLSPVVSSMSQVAISLLGIQLAHEIAHRFVAWRDKFDIGMPTFIPSIQLGLQGAITPFKSPPPNNKSLFDFAMAGPLAGLLVALSLLVTGMEFTTAIDLVDANQLPAFPVGLLRSSALGGGLIEYFVGKGVLLASSAEAVLPLHPFAISGFIGIISNALALLPLGNTDGGRILQVMFGRRGAYLVKTLTTLFLCIMGLVGLDESHVFLVHALFTMIWQRELEAPTLNEADELDFSRGLLGIGTSVIVFLALIPMI